MVNYDIETSSSTRTERLFRWLWVTLQPDEGWLSFALIVTTILIVTDNVAETQWVRGELHLHSTTVLAAIIGAILAKQSQKVWRAWALIVAYGTVIISLRLGEWWPGFGVWWEGWSAASAFARPQFALFINRLLTWAQRVTTGQESQDTLPFALGIGLLAWLCGAYLAWATYRDQRPLPALIILGIGLAFNNYFSQATDVYAVVLYLIVALSLVAIIRWNTLEQYWERNQIDYSRELRNEFAVAVGFLAAALPILSFWLPPLSMATIAQNFAQSAPVQRVELFLDRAFGGVDNAGGAFGSGTGGQGSAGSGGSTQVRSAGVLPRSNLIGGAPELYETVVMTATVISAENRLQRNTHWRALSYDVYTGSGWWRSDTRDAQLFANETIPIPAVQATIPVTQNVFWVKDNRRIRYTLGFPTAFDQAVTTFWAGTGDLTHVRGDGVTYQVETQISVASAQALDQVTLDNVPPLIMASYTALPSTVPTRVHELAAEITTDAPTPYQKAKAIEAFLRQYEYSLAVEAPPAGADVADFFLFDQQAGYCDYFATTMTVMARSVGLPARMAIGFAAQDADENGVQTLREINGHSWTEIYFEGYGWIEFEPTATFTVVGDAADETLAESAPDDAASDLPAAIPEAQPLPRQRSFAWVKWAIGLGLAVGLFVLWRRPVPELTQRWAQLKLLAEPLAIRADDCQTPHEFEARLTTYLAHVGSHHWLLQQPVWRRRVSDARRIVQETTGAFVALQYGEAADVSAENPPTRQAWRELILLFLTLRWLPDATPPQQRSMHQS